MKNKHRFKMQRIGDGVTAIDDNGWSTLYLIEGSQKAVLLDTGWGVGDLPGLLSSLTTLPVTVIHTHAHPDHVSGSYQFDEVMISAVDLPFFRRCFEPSYRKLKYEYFLKDSYQDSRAAERWINATPHNVNVIDPGSVYELGNRTIKTIPIPGHTPGSIALLDENKGLLFTGDIVMNGITWMHVDTSTTLYVFWESLQNLLRIKEHVTSLLPGHGKTPAPPSLIDELANGTREILDLKLKGIPIKTFAGSGWECRFDNCGIVYDENRLF